MRTNYEPMHSRGHADSENVSYMYLGQTA